MAWLGPVSSPVYGGGGSRVARDGGGGASPPPPSASLTAPPQAGEQRRAHPQALWPEAKSAVLVGLNYAPADDPIALLQHKRAGLVSAYAARRDYHDVIKGKLKQLAQWLARESGGDVKVFVDTAPLMEKPLAERAGLGWQGKHTNL
ncbi:MAG TPA: hypothetical protein DHW63_04360, partial [Hyphomonadaceae bacterium]|nr:hypothetical protein [Hyphomonadaceae bacterium]